MPQNGHGSPVVARNGQVIAVAPGTTAEGSTATASDAAPAQRSGRVSTAIHLLHRGRLPESGRAAEATSALGA